MKSPCLLGRTRLGCACVDPFWAVWRCKYYAALWPRFPLRPQWPRNLLVWAISEIERLFPIKSDECFVYSKWRVLYFKCGTPLKLCCGGDSGVQIYCKFRLKKRPFQSKFAVRRRSSAGPGRKNGASPLNCGKSNPISPRKQAPTNRPAAWIVPKNTVFHSFKKHRFS